MREICRGASRRIERDTSGFAKGHGSCPQRRIRARACLEHDQSSSIQRTSPEHRRQVPERSGTMWMVIGSGLPRISTSATCGKKQATSTMTTSRRFKKTSSCRGQINHHHHSRFHNHQYIHREHKSGSQHLGRPENLRQCGIPNARPSPLLLTALRIVPPPSTIIASCARCIASATARPHRVGRIYCLKYWAMSCNLSKTVLR